MFNLIRNELREIKNHSITENGAIGYKSTGSALLDLNYQVSSLRQADDELIRTLFDEAFLENKEYALKWLFFARDIRGGLGERRLFRVCYRRLAQIDPNYFVKFLHLIPEYGRWDDLISLLGYDLEHDGLIIHMIDRRLKMDKELMKNNKPISLLAKWLPSENASSKKTKMMAKYIIKSLGMSPRQYRLLLSELRAYLNVVEVKMCNNEWESIDYNKVPSLANLRYRNAFMAHDPLRRGRYLDAVQQGNAKINMKVATPADVVSRYTSNRFYSIPEENYDETLEVAWSNLSDINISNTLVVADGSGSMTTPVSGNITALDVANSLAIYTSEHNEGVYKDQYITFSNEPQFVDLSNSKTLREKINTALEHDEVANTNIEAVFDLILGVAIKNNVQRKDMVKQVLIISDMEFDSAQSCHSFFRKDETKKLSKPLFKEIQAKYEEALYQLPKLIFWNVASRTKTIPLTENELGVTLLSGFSQNVLKMVMSNNYNPYDVLIETLNNERYSCIKL